MRKKYPLLIGFMILVCVFSGLVVYLSGISAPGEPRWRWGTTVASDLQFIDGGSGSDTVVATVINRADREISVTSGYIVQSYWLNNGFIYRSHEQKAQLFGDLTVPCNGTADIHLSLPTDTLVAGKTYAVELNTTESYPPLEQCIGSANWFHTISAPQAFTYYHMIHPGEAGLVEEGIITSLGAAFCDSNYADSMSAEVRNTGDFPITIVGGFVNGRAAINATDSTIHMTGIEKCVIEKNATGSVSLNFPAGTLYYTKQNPFDVKLVTAEGNIIESADMCYSFDFPRSGKIQQPTTSVEKAEITSVQFLPKYGMYDWITASVYNFGSKPIVISSCLLNGKATAILSANTVIEAGSTQTIALQAGTLVQGNKYQLVLISSENNDFINTSTYS